VTVAASTTTTSARWPPRVAAVDFPAESAGSTQIAKRTRQVERLGGEFAAGAPRAVAPGDGQLEARPRVPRLDRRVGAEGQDGARRGE
jgi:hypothetical protein